MVQILLSNIWTTRLFFNNVHISSAHHFLALTLTKFLPCSQGMNCRRTREGDRMWTHKKHPTAATVHAWFHRDQPNESWWRSNWPDVCTLVTLNKIVLGFRARRWERANLLKLWLLSMTRFINQAAGVEKLDGTIHQINHFPVDKY